MEENIQEERNPVHVVKEELTKKEKELKRNLNALDKLMSSEEIDETKLLNQTKKVKIIKNELKELKKKYQSMMDELSEKMFENITLDAAMELADENCLITSSRGDRDLSKFTYYYSGVSYNYRKDTFYYLMRAYIINMMISRKKRINKYIKMSDDFIREKVIYCDVFENYLKKHGESKYITYAKRLLSK